MDSVGTPSGFGRKKWSRLSCAAVLLAVGCGSSASTSGSTDAFGNSIPGAKVRAHNGASLSGIGLSAVSKPPAPPPPGDIGSFSGVVGHWYLDRDKVRSTLVLDVTAGLLTGTIAGEGAADAARPLEHVSWDPGSGQLRFRVEDNGQSIWYAIDVIEGVMTGRYAVVAGGRVSPASWSAYAGHLMGWRGETFDTDLAPRVFDLVIDDGRYVRLRLDHGASNSAVSFIGEIKTKATTALGSAGELPAESILVRRWDGRQLVFDTTVGTVRQRFTGTVKGRNLEGTMLEDRASTTVHFAGTRANLLAYGLRQKTSEARTEWQERVRRILYRLTMAGNPAPIATAVKVTERALFVADQVSPDRDDDIGHWQQQYRLSDVVIDHTLPNPYGSEPLTRHMHGLLAIPTTPPPAGGYPLALTVNGHLVSAELQFHPDQEWTGDAFARRGYVVLAIDTSHRPSSESGGLYEDYVDGDSPQTGNHAHPAIAAPGLDSDWAEDGERAWDAMRGIDFLLAQHDVNPGKIVVTGLSMGGEVAEIVGALDPRATIVVPASAPPDLSLMMFRGNHPCWKWAHGDVTEFVDVSDYLALIAPRKLVLETGKWDYTFSWYAVPYAVEKENAWRARIAYGAEDGSFVHYLHAGQHQYRVGDASDQSPDPAYIQVPQLIAPPGARARPVDWEVDGATVSLDQTLFDFLAR